MVEFEFFFFLKRVKQMKEEKEKQEISKEAVAVMREAGV